MNPKVRWHQGHAESDADRSLVRFEVDRIALRRVFEAECGALIKEGDDSMRPMSGWSSRVDRAVSASSARPSLSDRS